ncbi:unnamed protein product [Rhizopus stolonifer]
MKAIADLYEIGRGKKKMRIRTTDSSRSSPNSSTIQSPSPITQSPISSPTIRETRHQSLPPPKQSTPEPKVVNKPRSQSNAGASNQSTNNKFNFEKIKPKIMQEVALANQNSNNLVNALKLINTSEDRWEIDLQYDARLQEYRNKCEDSRKKIVRYVRLVEDEEWIGTLLAANEDLLKGLDMYDIMLTGEIPAAWNPQESTKLVRPPPPPPPIKTTSPLQIEFSGLNLADNREEELDPFADPTTPIEEINVC